MDMDMRNNGGGDLDGFIGHMDGILEQVSNEGRAKFACAMDSLADFLNTNAETISVNGSIDGLIVLMANNISSGSFTMLQHRVRNDDDKDFIISEIKRMTSSNSYDVVFTIAEAWAAAYGRDKPIVRPSEHPQRREVVVTTCTLNLNFIPCVITAVQPIHREKDGPFIDNSECEFSVSTGKAISGKLTGYEKNICPLV